MFGEDESVHHQAIFLHSSEKKTPSAFITASLISSAVVRFRPMNRRVRFFIVFNDDDRFIFTNRIFNFNRSSRRPYATFPFSLSSNVLVVEHDPSS